MGSQRRREQRWDTGERGTAVAFARQEHLLHAFEPAVRCGTRTWRIPMKPPFHFGDRQVVDAGLATTHEPRVVKLPEFVAVAAEPLAGIVVPLVLEPHGDAMAAARAAPLEPGPCSMRRDRRTTLRLVQRRGGNSPPSRRSSMSMRQPVVSDSIAQEFKSCQPHAPYDRKNGLLVPGG